MKIKEIKLRTQRLIQVVDFYSQQLHLSIIHQTEEAVSFKVGDSILTFLKSEEVTHPYHFALNIPSHSILECYHYYRKSIDFVANVEDSSLEIPVYDFINWNAKALYFFDPDYNIVEFIARDDIQIPLLGEFTYKQLLSIGEMGIVVDDCLETARELDDKYQIPSFIRSEGNASFNPVGTDTGLFILVKENRVWYASDFLARKQFCGVRFEREGKEFEVAFS